MSEGFRIAPGFITADDLNNTSSYVLENFPRPSDMSSRFRWLRPTEWSNLSEFAELVDGFDNGRGAVGGIEFDWFLFLPTAGMVEYIRDTVFAGELSAPFTIQTNNRASLTTPWRVIWCYGLFPDLRKDAVPVGKGYEKVKIHFYEGINAPLGGEHTYEFTYEFT
jgi:hypothetical protein